MHSRPARAPTLGARSGASANGAGKPEPQPPHTTSAGAAGATNSGTSCSGSGSASSGGGGAAALLFTSLKSEADGHRGRMPRSRSAGGSTAASALAAVAGLAGGLSLLAGGGYLLREPIRHFLNFFINAVDQWGVWGYVSYILVYAGLEVGDARWQQAGGTSGGRGIRAAGAGAGRVGGLSRRWRAAHPALRTALQWAGRAGPAEQLGAFAWVEPRAPSPVAQPCHHRVPHLNPRRAQVLALPAIPLTMTAGAIFGVGAGTLVVTISALLAATVAFLISRYLARDRVRTGRSGGGRERTGVVRCRCRCRRGQGAGEAGASRWWEGAHA